MFKKTITILAIMLLLTTIPIAQAASVQPRFSHINTISTGIDIEGSVLWCFGGAESQFSDTYTYVYMSPMRCPQDGGDWVTITTWSASATGYSYAGVDKYLYVPIGYDYIVKVNVQIKDANNNILEDFTVYSDIVHYHTTD